jgi:hypothetical protein
MQIHPITFASKQTSNSESCYQPYLLEFTALKFSLDKFSNIIGGYPIEIKTDCKVLHDTIINNKLNATHAHWLDGIMGHHIIDCHHRLGMKITLLMVSAINSLTHPKCKVMGMIGRLILAGKQIWD